jgi:hypothetical protein
LQRGWSLLLISSCQIHLPILRLVVSSPSDFRLCCVFYPYLYTILASCALFSVIYLPQFLICLLFTMFIYLGAYLLLYYANCFLSNLFLVLKQTSAIATCASLFL